MAAIADPSRIPSDSRKQNEEKCLAESFSFYFWSQFGDELVLKEDAEEVVLGSESFTNAHDRRRNNRKLKRKKKKK